MLEMGLVVALGLVVMYVRLGWRKRIWINSNPLLMDILIFVILNVLHWGTFSGLMVAAVGALFCSITISIARKWIGYVESGRYVPGWMNVENLL